ncbi:hypothetical protein CEXT_515061 [Caerostris extrusa]|uniref:Uncharacterized protein n=1 Tax=Caerostris extrusa TaxID=172846 RepID=A0AAV4STB0_CAEEX|nr:hypothetical protein CEXT_515061 [Caerostris extrusa]
MSSLCETVKEEEEEKSLALDSFPMAIHLIPGEPVFLYFKSCCIFNALSSFRSLTHSVLSLMHTYPVISPSVSGSFIIIIPFLPPPYHRYCPGRTFLQPPSDREACSLWGEDR